MTSRLILVAEKNSHVDKTILDRFGFQISDAVLSDDGRCYTISSPQPVEDVQKSCAALPDLPYDFFAISKNTPRPKLLLCDMDSTIIESETLDDLADAVGLKNQIAEITERAMRGELDFEAALIARVEMLADLEERVLIDMLPHLKLSEGADTLISAARAAGIKTILVSGGFKHVTNYISDKLGFDANYANAFIIKKGRLTGEVQKPVQDKTAKLTILKEWADDLDISAQEVMAIGDGANDIPMLEAAGYGIAYRAKPLVQKAIPLQINKTDLSAAAYLF